VIGGLTLPSRPQFVRTQPNGSIVKYLDQINGMTADAAAAFALEHNAELEAMRNEAKAAAALIRQARLRANPTLDVTGSRQINGSDNSAMAQAEVPLELGGRRSSRIKVAEKELEVRVQAVAERERQLAYDLRKKFGESLAAIFKLKFAEETLTAATENLRLVAAQVNEGRRAPLEENMETVELNRIRAIRETSEGLVETDLLELRNLLGMTPQEPLLLKGDFDSLIARLPPLSDATTRALSTRPDILGARAIEALAAAKVEQARSEGRIDADVMLGYQRMKSGFPLLGIQESTGALLPIDSKFHFFTFGVKLMLPVRNRNQGMVEAALFEESAARNRREFGELTIRREVASAYAKFDRAVKAMEIYRVGVRDQAAANLDVVRQTFELGEKTLLDYIAEQRRFIDTENGYIDAQLEAYLSRLDVLRATNAPELVNK
jgi:cobalt-zinc-cadmium efflux system outer membrane protein